MKKCFLILMLISSLVEGCKKDDAVNGPLIATWHLSKYVKNGTDITPAYLNSFPDYCLTFTNNTSFMATYFDSITRRDTLVLGTYKVKNNDSLIDFLYPGQPTITANMLQLDYQVFRHIYASRGDSIERTFIRP